MFRLTVTDQADGTPLNGASFRIVATEAVISADGTQRYTAGQVVDTLVTDADGMAESKPLYVGEFELQQVETPFGYAGLA